MKFEEILKLYNYSDLDHRKIKDLEYLTPKGYDKFDNFLRDVSGKRYCINVDNDGDGAVSAKLIRHLLLDFGASSVKLYYQTIPHYVDSEMIEYCKGDESIAIVLDSSSNDRDLMRSAEENKVPLLIIDHHDIDGDIVSFYDTLYFTTVITSKVDSEEFTDMSCGMFIYFLMHKYYKIREKDPRIYFDLAVLSLTSDVCPMDKPYHRQIMKQYLNNTTRNQFISAFTNKYSYFTKSLLSMTISPTINALFRTLSYETLNKLMIEDDLINSIKYAREIYRHNKVILAKVLTQLTIYDYGNITYAHMLDFPSSFIAKNYTGLLANKILERYKKPCIVTCNDSDDILKGSIRSNVDLDIHNTLNTMKGIVKFGGHTNAHGFTLKKSEIDNLIYTFDTKATKKLALTSLKLENLSNIVDYMDVIEDIATFNEYAGSNVSPMGFSYKVSNYDMIVYEPNCTKLTSNIEIVAFYSIQPGDTIYIVPTISATGVQFIASAM